MLLLQTRVEIQDAPPPRTKVTTVQPRDTAQSLSHRMAGVDRPAARCRIFHWLGARSPAEGGGVVLTVIAWPSLLRADVPVIHVLRATEVGRGWPGQARP